ncbi:unnamed protein product [Adineta steineri]|uniref:Tetratricopeptide repeat protein n=1 Tax=Adineta steineri TaxID=433720 RepID=A0A815A2C2_9BILA|nr:unnamed protein product [Adineta steineri]CAF1536671.1 unnamed protein product [Adineta steineri]
MTARELSTEIPMMVKRSFPEDDNDEQIIIICFHPNNQIEDMKKQLHEMNDHVVFHTELESCISFIQSIENEKIFLIIFDSYACELVSHIDIFQQVHSIFIFYTKPEDFKYLFHEQLNIIGVYHRLDFFYSALEEQISVIAEQFFQWAFYDQTNFSKRDLSKQSSDFLWMQLFHDAISYFPHDEQAKEDMMNIFRLYADEKLYQSNDAIQWYLNNSFLQKLITKSLQRKDIDQLYQLRYFLVDLIENLTRECHTGNVVMYQQIKLSKHELNHFRQKQGQILSMKGFLLVKQDIVLPQRSDLVDVHLEIKCNIKEYQNKNEILFDLNTAFQLENIEENDQKILIRLTAVNYGQMIKEKYLKDTHRQIENLSIPIIFSKLMCDMNEWNQARKYLQYLLIHSNEQDLPWTEYFIGETFYEIGQLNEARLCYDRAIKSNKINLQDSSVVLSAIGKVLYSQGKYEEAYDFYQQALTIQKQFYPSDHAHIANSLDDIGLVFGRRLQYHQALDFLQQALEIREKYYEHFHVDIAISLHNISEIIIDQRKYDQALEYQKRAMSICKEYYPSNHTYIALLLFRIGSILYHQEICEESLNLSQQVLTIMKKLRSSGHLDVACTLTHIAHIRYGQGMHEESLQLYQQVLALLIQYYSSDHLDIVQTLINIDHTLLYGKENSE